MNATLSHRLVTRISVFLLLAWCLTLLAFRVRVAGHFVFSFLAWNLFLAWIPLAVSGLVWRLARKGGLGLFEVGLCGLWFLFFPNAPYLVTDLVHLSPRPPVPLWYDLAMLLSFAAAGLAMGYLSLRDVQLVLARRWGLALSWAFAVAALFVAAFGVYLGRFQRWNSWDLLTAPRRLLADVAHHLLDPHPRTVGMTLVFGVLLNLGYLFLVLWPRQRELDGTR